MSVKIGTFNLNNLFSRFNFSRTINAIQAGGTTGAVTIRYEFTDPDNHRSIIYLIRFGLVRRLPNHLKIRLLIGGQNTAEMAVIMIRPG
jgi:hypothetical protein